jgi:hypothetical protein
MYAQYTTARKRGRQDNEKESEVAFVQQNEALSPYGVVRVRPSREKEEKVKLLGLLTNASTQV